MLNYKKELDEFMAHQLEMVKHCKSKEDRIQYFHQACGAFVFVATMLTPVPDDFTEFNNYWQNGWRNQFLKYDVV